MGSQIWRFGTFELDAGRGELRKDGRRVRLEPQPQMLLAMLVELRGKVTTRRKLKEALWPDEPAYRTDENLNHVVKRLREALGDSGQNPRFVATIRNKGYRFLADVSTNTPPAPSQLPEKRDRHSSPAPRRDLFLAIAAGSILIAVAVLMSSTATDPADETVGPIRAVLPLEAELTFSSAPSIAISPNGRTIAYTAGPKSGEANLYLHDLASHEPRLVSGATEARLPFFSPDGDRVGFYSRTGGRLLQVPVSGGAPTPLGGAEIPFPAHGATWTASGDIVFATSAMSGLLRLTVDGRIETLTTPDIVRGEKSHRLPDALPGRDAVLFTIVTVDISSFDDARIAVLDLETMERKVLIEGGTSARYSPSGHILYWRGGCLYAAPIDQSTLRLTGAPRVLQVDVAAAPWSPAQFAIARNGTLAYVSGPSWVRGQQIAWVRRDGTAEPVAVGPIPVNGDVTNVALSPRGDKVAFVVGGATDHIWIHDFERRATSRLTFTWDNIFPTWSPDGERIAFWSNRGRGNGIFIAQLDSAKEPELVISSSNRVWPTSWSSDGRLLFMQRKQHDWDIGIATLAGSGEVSTRPWLSTPFSEGLAFFSPDERWVVYESDSSGQYEIYVRSQDEPDRIVQVSARGGHQPRWGPDGREIFYWEGDSLMVVDFSDSGAHVTLGAPTVLFENGVRTKHFDVSPDGRRVVMSIAPTPPAAATELQLVLNWPETLK